ncbi:helicase HerA domain-containing protein [Murdochiella vaginalis]|uniref:helicase HerA domain-containing protein n=1 Tax=Murdochiella vaginalis TaxID=1852373 RepID=UPI0008FE772F|nr:DUF87 domain-containing protein [Murdochiella vaginalis]
MKIMERLGEFYLGQQVNPETGEKEEIPFLYASSDLTTHAMLVGMTGSGKTGLGIDLLEEAIVDGLPAIVLDPKGDMANLLLAFPSISGTQLLPWITPQAAEQAGLTPEAYAEEEAKRWQEGRTAAGMDAARVSLLSQADITVYTPGSRTGEPLSVMDITQTPPEAILAEEESFTSYVSSTVAGLLALVDVDADPLTSKAHLLLSTLFSARWKAGEAMDLPSLISAIQQPGLDKIGVMPLEAFYPEKERLALAMRFNQLFASPQFAAWLEGAAPDPQRLLYTPEGKPRVAIISLAHLNDRERMFVVTLLLNQMVGWMRRQSGQTALRALLYMDEVQGYFPPVANPASKAPMMTLLKQARAFGLGIVLATQNPADLDYKGLSNIGTWFIGHLQTQQDRDRLLDGMDADGTLAQNRSELSALLSRLPKRTFYVHNIHARADALFSTRWTMSYLAGPVTGTQLKALTKKTNEADGTTKAAEVAPAASASGMAQAPGMSPASASVPSTSANPASAIPEAANGSATSGAAASQTAASPTAASSTATVPPLLPKGVAAYYHPAAGAASYTAYLCGSAKIFYEDEKAGIASEKACYYLTAIPAPPAGADWENAQREDPASFALQAEIPQGAAFQALSFDALAGDVMKNAKTSLKNFVYAKERLQVPYHRATGVYGRPGEEEAFAIRVDGALREARDQEMQKIKDTYQKKLNTMQERIRKAELAVQREETQAEAAKQSTMVSVGSALLGGLFGRKKISSSLVTRVGSSARSLSRQRAQEDDIRRAEANVEAYKEELQRLEEALAAELEQVSARFSTSRDAVEEVEIKPKKTNIQVQDLFLVWMPDGQ